MEGRYPGTKSVKQALAKIAAQAKKTPKGAWIYVACVSASENKFAEKRLPTRAELDKAAPNNPVLLANGAHLCVLDSPAMKLVGLQKGVARLPHGATVMLDKKGNPTGVVADAMANIRVAPTPEEAERYYTTGIPEFWNRQGFTSILAITPAAALPVLKKVAASETHPSLRFTLAVWTSANGQDMPENLSAFTLPANVEASWYRLGGIKAWVDGENDARTGYMYQPYLGHAATDPPGNMGTLVTDQPAADHFASVAHKAGAMCLFHCSGDHATDIGLNAYEHVLQTDGSGALMRIEHFGMFQLSDEQLARAKAMKKQGVFFSTQPIWLLELVKADYENMGARRASSGFRFRDMIEAGLEPAASTDMTGIYLENINPFRAMYAAVTRRSDKGVFQPEQAISVLEALKMWTIWAAKAMVEGDFKGSLEPGKFADMAVLSDDILTMPKENLKSVKVLQTIVGGRVVYEAK